MALRYINDPVYGMIPIKNPIITQIIDHSYFQRLRHIKQLGFTYMVFPGAVHNRFQHALGAYYLMGKAIETLTEKGFHIGDVDRVALQVAILLHDVGHGPFSHVFEGLIPTKHEEISKKVMERLATQVADGSEVIDRALDIFTGNVEQKFLHQLISSQVDIDRLDYLARDSFFAGVSEGMVGYERIIRLLTLTENGQLAFEHKALFSLERFLWSRYLMYVQVYTHKTVLAIEEAFSLLLKHLRDKADYLLPDLLKQVLTATSLTDQFLDAYLRLDDNDVLSFIKQLHFNKKTDQLTQYLTNALVNRRLLKVQLSNEPFNDAEIQSLSEQADGKLFKGAGKLIISGEMETYAYIPKGDPVWLIFPDGTKKKLEELSPTIQKSAITEKRYYLCYPVELKDEVYRILYSRGSKGET
ncbi:MAG: HD domain-containing protein [Chlorobi bacterium]|nr:HD domain-containing protein [Chlorobiota bacterium]